MDSGQFVSLVYSLLIVQKEDGTCYTCIGYHTLNNPKQISHTKDWWYSWLISLVLSRRIILKSCCHWDWFPLEILLASVYFWWCCLDLQILLPLSIGWWIVFSIQTGSYLWAHWLMKWWCILEMNKSTRVISPWNQNRCILMQRKVNISWEICISLDTLSQNNVAKRCCQSRSINWNCSWCFAVISLVLIFMCKHNQILHYFITWKILGMICLVLFVVVYSQ